MPTLRMVWYRLSNRSSSTIMTCFRRRHLSFVVPALYELCERESVSYVIRLKANANLKKLADELHPTGTPADITQTEPFIEETIYQAGSWSKPRKIIIQSVRSAGEL